MQKCFVFAYNLFIVTDIFFLDHAKTVILSLKSFIFLQLSLFISLTDASIFLAPLPKQTSWCSRDRTR